MPAGDTETIIAWKSKVLSEQSIKPPTTPGNSISRGSFTCYSSRLHDFSVTIRRPYKDVYANSFSARSARPWNSPCAGCFPFTNLIGHWNSSRAGCFPLTDNLNGLKA